MFGCVLGPLVYGTYSLLHSRWRKPLLPGCTPGASVDLPILWSQFHFPNIYICTLTFFICISIVSDATNTCFNMIVVIICLYMCICIHAWTEPAPPEVSKTASDALSATQASCCVCSWFLKPQAPKSRHSSPLRPWSILCS